IDKGKVPLHPIIEEEETGQYITETKKLFKEIKIEPLISLDISNLQ
ncbi:2593_t:CDS:1, partial [Ambispora gerdemannii]